MKPSAKASRPGKGRLVKRKTPVLSYSLGTAKNPEMVFQFAREGATKADLMRADRILERMIHKLTKLKTIN